VAISTTYDEASRVDHGAQLRKAVVAATIGTTIEWYDFFLYGTAAGLIFGKLYFPNSDPLTATLAAFGTYFVGFVGRPIGAADLRALRRPHRSQGDPDRHAADHGDRDLPDRVRADL
jgi:hypothetical protein